MSLAQRLPEVWYRPRANAAAIALWPLSLLYASLVALRRGAYRLGLLDRQRLPVPVIVVGNITVGGSGKTPIVRALVHELRERGLHPGVVSRGYGGSRKGPHVVIPSDAAAEVGDEPAMLARGGIPVAVGRDRAGAARALLDRHREVDVIVSDDGLQHYALARDVEIVVVDATRVFGNGLHLPAGPLREPVSRLREADAVVLRGAGPPVPGVGPAPTFSASEDVLPLRNLADAARSADLASLPQGTVHAVAGIADPARFFAKLRGMGLTIVEHAFPDHYPFVRSDLQLPGARAIVMTEKDAVKCAAFADAHMWFLPIEARLPPELPALVLERIRGRQAA